MTIFVGQIEVNIEETNRDSTISITVPDTVREHFQHDLSEAMESLPNNSDLRTIITILIGMMATKKHQP